MCVGASSIMGLISFLCVQYHVLLTEIIIHFEPFNHIISAESNDEHAATVSESHSDSFLDALKSQQVSNTCSVT